MKLNDVPPPPLKKARDKVRGRKPRPFSKVSAEYAKNEAKQKQKELENLKKEVVLREKEAELLSKGAILTSEDVVDVLSTKVQFDEKDVIFRPNPGPQTRFLAASEREVFYGGARGGGKSYAMLIDPLRYCNYAAHRAVIIRKTMPELRDLIFKAMHLYPKAFPGTKFKSQESTFYFPSGARIEFGFAESTKDVLRYQGQSYTWIGVDELPQYESSEVLDMLRSSLRSTDPNIPIQLRATGNPGNIGSTWVREQFIDPALPDIPFEIAVNVKTPLGEKQEIITRRFIPAKVWDNPYLTFDLSYAAMLANLPEVKRKQFLDGDWDAFEGAAFPEFDKNTHVVNAYPVPSSWPRFRGGDWGYNSPGCVLWCAVTPDKEIVVYRELYFKGLTAPEVAERVLNLESGENVAYGILDISAWSRRGEMGPSIGQTMNEWGCRWKPSGRVAVQGARNSRISGKMEVHRRLAINPRTGKPWLTIMNNCANLIRTLPRLPVDKNDNEDVDTDAEDHAYDALRYALMSRPVHIGGLMVDRANPTKSPKFIPVDKTFGY